MNFSNFIITPLCSVAAAVIAAIVASKSQLKQASIHMFLDARLKAFQEYEASIEAWANKKSVENTAALFHAINNAVLVSSDDTISALGNVQTMIYAYMETHIMNVDVFQRARTAALAAMRKDLLTYPIPKPSSSLIRTIRLKLQAGIQGLRSQQGTKPSK